MAFTTSEKGLLCDAQWIECKTVELCWMMKMVQCLRGRADHWEFEEFSCYFRMLQPLWNWQIMSAGFQSF
jgi:hypothetical protein